jgi:hypothetical protein
VSTAESSGGVTRGVPGAEENGLAAANKMDDFQTVALSKTGDRPLLARYQFAVQFDGHAILFQAQLLEQRVQGEGGDEIARLAVDFESHGDHCHRGRAGLQGGNGRQPCPGYLTSTFRSWNLRVAVRPE